MSGRVQVVVGTASNVDAQKRRIEGEEAEDGNFSAFGRGRSNKNSYLLNGEDNRCFSRKNLRVANDVKKPWERRPRRRRAQTAAGGESWSI